MKLIADADKFVSGKALSPEAALRLAARLQKAGADAPKTSAGLYEVARERVLNHVLRIHASPIPDGATTCATVLYPTKHKAVP